MKWKFEDLYKDTPLPMDLLKSIIAQIARKYTILKFACIAETSLSSFLLIIRNRKIACEMVRSHNFSKILLSSLKLNRIYFPLSIKLHWNENKQICVYKLVTFRYWLINVSSSPISQSPSNKRTYERKFCYKYCS